MPAIGRHGTKFLSLTRLSLFVDRIRSLSRCTSSILNLCTVDNGKSRVFSWSYKHGCEHIGDQHARSQPLTSVIPCHHQSVGQDDMLCVHRLLQRININSNPQMKEKREKRSNNVLNVSHKQPIVAPWAWNTILGSELLCNVRINLVITNRQVHQRQDKRLRSIIKESF